MVDSLEKRGAQADTRTQAGAGTPALALFPAPLNQLTADRVATANNHYTRLPEERDQPPADAATTETDNPAPT